MEHICEALTYPTLSSIIRRLHMSEIFYTPCTCVLDGYRHCFMASEVKIFSEILPRYESNFSPF